MNTILVLEDDAIVMNVFRGVLEASNYRVLSSTNAEEALAWSGSRPTIDLLIADVALPVSSGVAVALQLRQRIPALKIILTSGYPPDIWGPRHRAELDQIPSDAVRILSKPFLPKELLAMVSALVGTAPDSGVAEFAGSSQVKRR